MINKSSITDILLIGFNRSYNGDNTVLIVGRKRPNEKIDIVNTFRDDEAMELYLKLVTLKSKKDDSNDE